MDLINAYTNEIYDVDTPIYMTSLFDVCRLVPKIVVDERTVNKSVYIYGDKLKQLDFLRILKRDPLTMVTKSKKDFQEIIKNKNKLDEDSNMESYIYSIFFNKDGCNIGDSINIYDLYPEEKILSLEEFIKNNKFEYTF